MPLRCPTPFKRIVQPTAAAAADPAVATIDLSIGIAAGSGTQIALFVVPILVFAGIALGQTFTLEFSPYMS
jgi:Ca2+/H+ antiporter